MARYAFCQLNWRDQLQCIEINHPQFCATLVLQGAQLIEFSPHGETNWLWLSESAQYRRGQSLRGGIPICWPWFGDADKNPPDVQQLINDRGNSRAHGFARNEIWQLEDISESCNTVGITLSLLAENRKDWHGQAKLSAHFLFSRKHCQLSLTTTNLSTQALALSQALHTYFPTTEIKQSRVYGLEGCSYLDALQTDNNSDNGSGNNWRRMKQQAPVSFAQEVDRVYYPRSYNLRLQTPQHITNISSQNSHSCVVWNPWVNKAKRLSQFADDAYQRMLCIETANVMDDQVQLAPGESHQLQLTLSR